MGSNYTLMDATDRERILLFSSNRPNHDQEAGCIGHMRADFGRDGRGFWVSWEDHCADLKTPAFRSEFDTVINALREDVLRDYDSMKDYCRKSPQAKINGWHEHSYGFKLKTDNHVYYLRCCTLRNDYNLYCYAYNRETLEKNMPLLAFAGKPEEKVPDEIKEKLEKLAAHMITRSTEETVSGSFYMNLDDVPADIIAPDVFAQYVDAFVDELHQYEAVAQTEIGSDGVIDITLYLDYCPNYEPSEDEQENYPSDRKILDPLKKRVPDPTDIPAKPPAEKPSLMERLDENKKKAARHKPPGKPRSPHKTNLEV